MHTSTSPDRAGRIDQLASLNVLLEQALSESDALRHRIREIQLRVKQLTIASEPPNPHP